MLPTSVYKCWSAPIVGTSSSIYRPFGHFRCSGSVKINCRNHSDTRVYQDLHNTRGYIPPLYTVSTSFRPGLPEGSPSSGGGVYITFLGALTSNQPSRSCPVLMPLLLAMEQFLDLNESEEMAATIAPQRQLSSDRQSRGYTCHSTGYDP